MAYNDIPVINLIAKSNFLMRAGRNAREKYLRHIKKSYGEHALSFLCMVCDTRLSDVHLDTGVCPRCFYFCFIQDSWSDDQWETQSEEVEILAGTGQGPTEVETETVTFMDANSGKDTGRTSVFDPVSSADLTPSVSLNEYLSRPVLINTINWATASVTGANIASIAPWQLFFNTLSIKNKLTNYAFLKCDLKLKILINASPFYYGAVLAAYKPLPTMNDDTVYDIGGATYDTGTRSLIPMSQRPHSWIYPQDSLGAEMTLPFFYFKNQLSIGVNVDFTDMGTLDFLVFAPLLSANGVASSTVTIQTFAWAENVDISGPTVALALQSKDEYGKKPISKVASSMATALSYLTNVPFIGNFAKASEIGCKVVAAGAAAAGYSNAPVIDDTIPYKYQVYPPMSTSEISYPFEKLTHDPKQELSIDPAIVGLPSEDELSIAHLVSKESYLTQAQWTTTGAIDDELFSCSVIPGMYDYENLTATSTKAYRVYYQTPMSWVSQLFDCWRGDIIYRFRVICSPFHKGRLRISYDPYGQNTNNIGLVSNTSSMVQTAVIDLGNNPMVEIRVPYQQNTTFLNTNKITTNATPFTINTNGTLISAPGFDNGVINVKILTVLSAPVATAPVTLLVSVRGADNLEFANPSSEFMSGTTTTSYSPWRTQSIFDPEDNIKVLGVQKEPPESRYLSYFGEAIPSLRQLLRRMSEVDVITSPSASAIEGVGLLRFNMTKYPPSPGYDPYGLFNVTGIVPSSKPFSYTAYHPISYVSQAFIGTRGSVNWVLSQFGTTNTHAILRAFRTPALTTTIGVPSVTTYTWGTTNSARAGIARGFIGNSYVGVSGTAITQVEANPVLSVSLPNYSTYKFLGTGKSQALRPSEGAASSQQRREVTNIEYMCNPIVSDIGKVKIVRYAGIGLDYTLHFFLNVPVMFSYTNPTPV